MTGYSFTSFVSVSMLTCIAVSIALSYTSDSERSHTKFEMCSVPLHHLHHRQERAVVRERFRIWNNATIPFLIVEGMFSPDNVEVIKSSMEVWMKHTCVKFKPWTGEMDFIVFKSTYAGCTAPIGNEGGWQEVILGRNCFLKPGYVVHELGHVLGLWHEHDRPDRDKYIEVLWENIHKDREFLFRKREKKLVQSFGSTYDYGSIMHYTLYAFSGNGQPTLKPKMNYYTGLIGQRESPSDQDYLQLRYLYGCQKYLPPCNEESSSGSGNWDPVFLPGTFEDNDTRNCTDINFDVTQMSPSSALRSSSSHWPITDRITSLVFTDSSQFVQKSSAVSVTTSSSSNQPLVSSVYTIKSTLTSQTSLTSVMTQPTATVEVTGSDEASSLTLISPIPSVTFAMSSLLLMHQTTTSQLTPSLMPLPYPTQTGSSVSLKMTTETPMPSNIPVISDGPISLIVRDNQTHWISCDPSRCKLKECKRNMEGYPNNCSHALLRFEKVFKGDPDIHVGDVVVLRAHDDNASIITCGRGTCRRRKYCPVLTTKKCKRHQLKVLADDKYEGEKINHNDSISLRFNQLSNNWIECDLDDMRCMRHSCPIADDCQFQKFLILKM